jgi:hypothetical protein
MALVTVSAEIAVNSIWTEERLSDGKLEEIA